MRLEWRGIRLNAATGTHALKTDLISPVNSKLKLIILFLDEFWILDAAEYYFDNAMRLADVR